MIPSAFRVTSTALVLTLAGLLASPTGAQQGTGHRTPAGFLPPQHVGGSIAAP